MSDGTVPMVARSLPGLPPRLRRRVALTFMAVILAAASSPRRCCSRAPRMSGSAIESDALGTAIALSFGFDQEVAAGNYLLKGLSTSPALTRATSRPSTTSSRRRRFRTAPG